MRVLVTGATGFVGRALAASLLRDGHEVICAARRPERLALRGSWRPLAVDMEQVPTREWWLRQLGGVHAVINAVGIIRETKAQSFRRLHTEGPIQLFEACAEARVRVVQISALGADDQARSGYHLSKKGADDALRAMALPAAAIVQPSLVYGPAGASARLFNQLAVLPLVALPMGGRMQVQPVHLDDVVAGILALLAGPPDAHRTIAFVGPRPLSLRDYLALLRSAMGMSGRLRVLPVPEFVFRSGASIAAHVPGSVLDAETADMLMRGSTAPSDRFRHLLGRSLRPVEDFVQPDEAEAFRTAAVLGTALPLLRVCLAFLWIWTGIVSLGVYPIQESLALLARVGLHGTSALVALYGAAALDLLLGIATLAAPSRLRSPVWTLQLALIVGYTVLISVFLPEYWLHPYGPITKNLPMAAAIALMWGLDRRWTT